MKIIKPEDLPIEMNEENLEILARMSLVMPPLLDYNLLIKYLSQADKFKIYNKASLIKEEQEKQRWESLTNEEQKEEKIKIKASLKEGPRVFRGNILQQEWDSIELERLKKENKNENF